jgi:uncharacterized membrane protein YjgN (DUF898 family)
MELNGAFWLSCRGGALFLSWLLMSIFLFILILVAELHPFLGSLVILLMLVMPFLYGEKPAIQCADDHIK